MFKFFLMLMFLCYFNCGYIEKKPGPLSKRAVVVDACIRYIESISNQSNKQQRNDNFNLCILYSLTLSNDPTDCESNSIRKFLEKEKILETGGCRSNSPRK